MLLVTSRIEVAKAIYLRAAFYRPPGNPVLVGSDTFGRYQSGIPTHRYGGPAACLCSPNLQVGRYLQLQHRICSNVKVRLKAQLKVKHALGTRPTGPLLRESTGCIFNNPHVHAYFWSRTNGNEQFMLSRKSLSPISRTRLQSSMISISKITPVLYR